MWWTDCCATRALITLKRPLSYCYCLFSLRALLQPGGDWQTHPQGRDGGVHLISGRKEYNEWVIKTQRRDCRRPLNPSRAQVTMIRRGNPTDCGANTLHLCPLCTQAAQDTAVYGFYLITGQTPLTPCKDTTEILFGIGLLVYDVVGCGMFEQATHFLGTMSRQAQVKTGSKKSVKQTLIALETPNCQWTKLLINHKNTLHLDIYLIILILLKLVVLNVTYFRIH